MTDDATARTARGNPRPTRATRAPRRPHRDRSGCEITLLVSKGCQNTTPLDKVAVSAHRAATPWRWTDADGAALPLLCRVEQIKACPQAGATPTRLRQQGQVVGWDTTWPCWYQQVLHRREHANHARLVTVVPRPRTAPD